MPTEENQISITWDGNGWQVETSVPTSRIRPGATFFTAVTDSVLLPEATTEDRTHLMFPAGTFLYLPLNAVQNVEELERLWQVHKEEVQPRLSKSPHRPLVPIRVMEDLLLEPAGRFHRLRKADCEICGLKMIHPSLNAAASFCLLRYTARQAGTLNVFDGVMFIHERKFRALDHQRNFLLYGTAIPEGAEEDGTGKLFPELE